MSAAPRRRATAVPTRSRAPGGWQIERRGQRRRELEALRPHGVSGPRADERAPRDGPRIARRGEPRVRRRGASASTPLGTPVEPVGTQLLVPAITRRPAAQRTSSSTSTRSGPPPCARDDVVVHLDALQPVEELERARGLRAEHDGVVDEAVAPQRLARAVPAHADRPPLPALAGGRCQPRPSPPRARLRSAPSGPMSSSSR